MGPAAWCAAPQQAELALRDVECGRLRTANAELCTATEQLRSDCAEMAHDRDAADVAGLRLMQQLKDATMVAACREGALRYYIHAMEVGAAGCITLVLPGHSSSGCACSAVCTAWLACSWSCSIGSSTLTDAPYAAWRICLPQVQLARCIAERARVRAGLLDVVA